MPVVEHYERQRKLAKISAVPPPEEVRAQMSAWPHCTSETKQALQKPCCTHRLAERTASSYDMHWCMMSEGPRSVCVSMRLMREDECQHRGCPKVKALIVVLSLISNQAAPNVHARMRVLGPAVICESTEGAGRLAVHGSNGSVTKHAHMRCIFREKGWLRRCLWKCRGRWIACLHRAARPLPATVTMQHPMLRRPNWPHDRGGCACDRL